MSNDLKIQDALSKLRKKSAYTFITKVISVDKANGTCVVSDGDLEYTGVALSAQIVENSKKFHLFPKVGSVVFVSPVEEDLHRLYVEFFSEIEDFDLQIEGTRMQIDTDGFLLKKENETLKALMVDLLTAIEAMRFTTRSGPTIKLLNKQQFTDIKNRFKEFLKDN